jgi:hypothetical protein
MATLEDLEALKELRLSFCGSTLQKSTPNSLIVLWESDGGAGDSAQHEQLFLLPKQGLKPLAFSLSLALLLTSMSTKAAHFFLRTAAEVTGERASTGESRQGGNKHLGGILIGMVSMPGSMKAERAPDSKNFLAHSKECGLISRPIKKAAHNFGTKMRSALGGQSSAQEEKRFLARKSSQARS